MDFVRVLGLSVIGGFAVMQLLLLLKALSLALKENKKAEEKVGFAKILKSTMTLFWESQRFESVEEMPKIVKCGLPISIAIMAFLIAGPQNSLNWLLDGGKTNNAIILSMSVCSLYVIAVAVEIFKFSRKLKKKGFQEAATADEVKNLLKNAKGLLSLFAIYALCDLMSLWCC